MLAAFPKPYVLYALLNLGPWPNYELEKGQSSSGRPESGCYCTPLENYNLALVRVLALRRSPRRGCSRFFEFWLSGEARGGGGRVFSNSGSREKRAEVV